MALPQRRFGEQVRVHRVFHVHHVDAVAAVADDPQPAGARSRQHAGHEMRIADAPNQVRPQRDRAERWRVGREDLALGRSADVQGTPTMFINGKRVMNRSFDAMKAMIDDELKKAKS